VQRTAIFVAAKAAQSFIGAAHRNIWLWQKIMFMLFTQTFAS
jgi:hypothetical protein